MPRFRPSQDKNDVTMTTTARSVRVMQQPIWAAESAEESEEEEEEEDGTVAVRSTAMARANPSSSSSSALRWTLPVN